MSFFLSYSFFSLSLSHLLVISLTDIAVFSWLQFAFKHTEERHYSKGCAEHNVSAARSYGVFVKVKILATDNVSTALELLPFQNISHAAQRPQLSVKKKRHLQSLELKIFLLKAVKLLDTLNTGHPTELSWKNPSGHKHSLTLPTESEKYKKSPTKG